jgi:hypothetical protein
MKKVSIVVGALVLSFGVSAFAAEVTGVLVDQACYTKDKANTTKGAPVTLPHF